MDKQEKKSAVPVKGQTLRVISYNTHKGRDLLGKKSVVAAMRRALEELDADLVLLQEVQGFLAGGTRRQKKLDQDTQKQLEYFADSVWPHYAYGQNATYDSGHHGNAILSKFPIRESRNIDISCRPWEERGILHAVIDLSPDSVDIPDQPSNLLDVFSTHFGLFELFRRKQSAALCDLISRELGSDRSFVLGGDFNDWRQTLTFYLEERLGCHEVFTKVYGSPAQSFPSIKPLLHLDRIYTRGFMIARVKVLSGEPWAKLSDHAPIYAELIRLS